MEIGIIRGSLKQQMADSIWRDQRKWELEHKLYLELIVSLGESRRIYMLLMKPEVYDQYEGQIEELQANDLALDNGRRELLQRASLLMPAEIFNEFRGALSPGPNMAPPLSTIEGRCQFFADREAAFVNAENFVRAHARKRLGVT